MVKLSAASALFNQVLAVVVGLNLVSAYQERLPLGFVNAIKSLKTPNVFGFRLDLFDDFENVLTHA